ncbi:MAG: hypothetical protein LJE59_08580 [Chromatiaceae bacterium]|nr:hypothetical protein [Chromatiaceae bacterium]
MNGRRADRTLQVFYRDYSNGVSISSTHPESLPAHRIVPLADRVLASIDNFLGVVDRNDVILQCYVADQAAELTLELVYPEASGCLRLTLPRGQALDILDHLPELFDESLLGGAQYID